VTLEQIGIWVGVFCVFLIYALVISMCVASSRSDDKDWW
jgi:hypothetical protein